MTARMILLDAKPLSAADVAEIARRNARLTLGEEAMRRIRASRALIEQLTQLGKPMYGVTTGLGACVDTPLAQADLIAFQPSVPLSHSMGIGPALPTEAVRALMAARISGMAAGGTGTSERVVMGLVAALNAGVHPVIPTWGSIGAADLAHLGHMARALRGDGETEYQGKIMPSAEALALAGSNRSTCARRTATPSSSPTACRPARRACVSKTSPISSTGRWPRWRSTTRRSVLP